MSRNKKKANKMVKEKKEDENGVFLILLIIVEAMLVLLVLYYIVHVSVWTFLATSGFIEAKTHQKTNEIPTFYSFVYSFFFHTKKTKYQENSKKSFSKQPLTFSNNVNKVKIKNIVGDIGEKVIATQSGKKENQLPPNQDNSIVGLLADNKDSVDEYKDNSIMKQEIELVLGEESQQSIEKARAILIYKLQKLRSKIYSKYSTV